MTETNHPDAEFTGKYENEGRIGGLLVDAFYSSVRVLLEPHLQTGGLVLEVGCGAGYSSERIRSWLPEGCSYLGSDIGVSLLRAAERRNPDASFLLQSVYELSLPDKSVDVAVMLEVLEHLEYPQRALAELRRVTRNHVVISTPREPIWRALNFARGKYTDDWGNTPGHLQHWSSSGLRQCVAAHFEVVGMRQPLPWTVLSLIPKP